MIQSIQNKIKTSKTFLEKHKALVPFLTFLGGFLFDVFTLNRIDQWPVIIQQAVFIFLAALLLLSLFLRQDWTIPKYPTLEKTLKYRTAALHFLYGSLLSSYTIFYFKSSSFAVSFAFLLIIALLLVANEFPHFQRLGLGIKSALLAISTLSFLSYVIPIIMGALGAGVFILSTLASSGLLFVFIYVLRKKQLPDDQIRKQVFLPFSAVVLVFLLTYFFKILPPVPLSLQYSGVYHTVEKTVQNQYKLGHYKPWWNFWDNGDQSFLAAENDKIVLFFRLFAPGNFTEQIHLVWNWKNANGVWELQDKIPISISGGRDEGFRGYGTKSNFNEGQWKAAVVTSDDREIGRIYFEVEKSSVPPDSPIKYDYH